MIHLIYITSIAILIAFFIIKLRRLKIKLNKSDKSLSDFKSVLNEPCSGRYGAISTSVGFLEFKEIVRADRYSKIAVLSIYPDHDKTEMDVIKKIGNINWVFEYSIVTSDYKINWFDDNQSRIREDKLNNIIK